MDWDCIIILYVYIFIIYILIYIYILCTAVIKKRACGTGDKDQLKCIRYNKMLTPQFRFQRFLLSLREEKHILWNYVTSTHIYNSECYNL